MTTRRRFGGEFKARVALEALRGDKTVQEIASKHKVHPNQVSTWKRQAIDGLSEVFSNGTDRERQDHETEVRDLHAMCGRLRVGKAFFHVCSIGRCSHVFGLLARYT
jgi:transposase-like protein